MQTEVGYMKVQTWNLSYGDNPMIGEGACATDQRNKNTIQPSSPGLFEDSQ